MGAITDSASRARPLAAAIGGFGYFALAFGTIVGSGWVVMLGVWLGLAGPGGALIAFICGGVVMTMIAACYAELLVRFPQSGGEVVFVREAFGPAPAFFVGWFLTIFLISFTAFEAISISWFLETLFPSIKTDPIYYVRGEAVRLSSILIGIAGAIFFTALNLAGVRQAVFFQRIVTFSFIALAAALVAAGLIWGETENLQPAFHSLTASHWTVGAIWVFATSLTFMNGFQSAIYAVEERRAGMSSRFIAIIVIGSVVSAMLFYLLIILGGAMSNPWQATTTAELPSAFAFGALDGSGTLFFMVIAGASISLLKTWNALHLAAARLLMGQADVGFIPSVFGKISKRTGVPFVGVLFVGSFTIAGVFFGRGGIVPILNMCTFCVAVSYVACLLSLFRFRARDREPVEFVAPGGRVGIGLALMGAAVAAVTALLEPFWAGSIFPIEWRMLAIAIMIGGILRLMSARRTAVAG